MSLLDGLLGGLSHIHSPLLRTAVPCAAVAVGLQAAVGLPSTFAVHPATERYYDLTGAVTHVAAAALSLVLPRWWLARATETAPGGDMAGTVRLAPPHWRQLALTGAVVVWALRLGSFLFRRMRREGKDSRFDAMRASPGKLLVAWAAQALWVMLCQAPLLAVNTVPAPLLPPGADAAAAALSSAFPSGVQWTDVVGFGLYAVGLVTETVADQQRDSWLQAKHLKQHDEVFMARGLWSRSRHPNYFGETTLWTGLAVAAAGVLTRPAVREALGGLGVATSLAVATVSPAFTALLLLKVSGVPLSEPKYDRKYGQRKDYQAWKANTPLFFPRLF
ncbi:hypothetical protein SPI_00873 [Niveomyces insectorum RCEF 264]|uniref:Uncharacterized protein n=1 Tax=Niveomyces insectorum RCEF 264 TaxID=1081102 RepID=A0A168AFP4_9HYPO|nr:hypothetical protein SPI_00873 [Niveomyces insectorum RCEF 264]